MNLKTFGVTISPKTRFDSSTKVIKGLYRRQHSCSTLIPIGVDWRKPHLIRGEVFALPRAGELDIGDAARSHRHGKDGDRIPRGLTARSRFQTGAVDHLAFS